MKKLLIAAAFFAAIHTNAQVKTPQASLKSQIEQAVGLTNIEVDYFRPSKRAVWFLAI